MAVVAQDASRLVRSYQTIGLLLPGADLALLEQAEARLFALFGGKSIAELRQVDPEQMLQFADD